MSIASRISAGNRERKFRLFLDIVKPSPTSAVLDVGFTEDEYSATDNYIEKHYPHLDKITALGIAEPKKFNKRYPMVKAVQYDGREFPFRDKEFDICWSNAVIEHVGDRDRQIMFLKEMKRVARTVFFTTPNRCFPVEVHTRILLLHFLPKHIFDKYLHLSGRQWAAGDYMHLLSLRDLRSIIESAGISDYRVVRNRMLFFTLDYVVIFSDDKTSAGAFTNTGYKEMAS